MTDRYVVLGLATARSPWFRTVAAWANSGAAPIEFHKCVSAVELRAHLAGGRAFSAALVDAAVPALDRDLVDAARTVGCAVVVVHDVRVTRDWMAMGASAVVDAAFERDDLVAVLREHASPISRADLVPGRDVAERRAGDDAPARTPRALLVGVCGTGGTGASTIAIALAQGLAADVRYGGLVLLADLARNGEQAMLHDARDVVPGLQEMVALHRTAQPTTVEVRATAFTVEERGYDLLLGMRRRGAWAAIRSRAFDAALESMRLAWRAVVCDLDADVECEADSGSADVEERNHLTRAVVAAADVVLASGHAGMKGTHSLARLVSDLVDAGAPPDRIVPVVSRAPKHARQRAEIAKTLAALVGANATVASPVFLPDRRVDDALRDGARMPSPLPALLTAAVAAVLTQAAARTSTAPAPIRVQPGSLGSWSATPESA